MCARRFQWLCEVRPLLLGVIENFDAALSASFWCLLGRSRTQYHHLAAARSFLGFDSEIWRSSFEFDWSGARVSAGS